MSAIETLGQEAGQVAKAAANPPMRVQRRMRQRRGATALQHRIWR